MKNDDYGFYGKGLDGYVHYRQGMQEAARNAPNASGGRRPVSAEQKTTEPAPKSDESGPDQQVDPAASAAYGVHDQLVYCADLRDY